MIDIDEELETIRRATLAPTTTELENALVAVVQAFEKLEKAIKDSKPIQAGPPSDVWYR